jgi:hypothetical protein
MEKLQGKVTPPDKLLGGFTPPHALCLLGERMSDYIQLPDSRWRLKEPLKKRPVTLAFDPEDMAYLGVNFDAKQLRNELKTAEIQAAVARAFAEDADVTFWTEYQKLCQQALETQRAKQPKPGKSSARAIREANDIVEIVSRYIELHKSGKEYVGRCPFHDDRHPSLAVNEEKQKFHCFSCDKGGDVIDFVREMENTDTKGAMALLRNCGVKTCA